MTESYYSKEDSVDEEKNGKASVVASKMLDAAVGDLPSSSGSSMNIFKQDPSVKDLAVRKIYLHTTVRSGPCDSQIVVEGLPSVEPDMNGDFLYEPSSEEAFNAVHTYAVVRQVLTMYQRALGEKMQWQWNNNGNSDPISVFPQAGETANAYYYRPEKVLKFFYFKSYNAQGEICRVYTCRSLDIVAHETGHAILDSLKPNWLYDYRRAQVGGLHESFADLTAIFLILSQFDQVEYILAQTKANLHNKNILAELAEQFGASRGQRNGLRNADNNLKLSDVGNGIYDNSKVFTGGIYDTLADVFTANRDPRRKDDCQVLFDMGRKMTVLTINGFKSAPARSPRFADVVNNMIDMAQNNPTDYPEFARFLSKHFEFREVIGGAAMASSETESVFGASTQNCCGTFQKLILA